MSRHGDISRYIFTMMTPQRLLLFAILAILIAIAPRVGAQQTGAPVLLAEVTGVIGPPASHHVETAIEEAEARNAELLILQLNTPGGLETSMRDIIEDILDSRVPVIGYVAPSGGRAASAGTFILYATHVAAMAPGTNVGAATPVELGGGSPEPIDQDGDESKGGEAEAPTNTDALSRKAVNDAAAFIRSLSALRGRNAEWAERAVRYGEAISASEALELGAVEIIATDVEDLLRQLDGRTVSMPSGERTLSTQGRLVERVEPSFVTQMLGVLANPNVAFLLMLIGVYGLIYEFASPGSIGPGVLGAVCLVLGLYALNQLPLNYAGLALIVLGIAFMVAEAFTPTFGVLGVGGAIAFLIGGAMLIDTDLPEYQLSWFVIIASAALTGGFVALAMGYTLKTHRRRAVTGREGLIGSRAKVLDWSGESGHVWVASERWNARGPEGLTADSWVRVTGVDSLKLEVTPDDSPQGDAS
jgi:membrane-bound serine protease (ClpP class)